MISLLPKSNSPLRILEVGAGGGDTLVTIKQKNLAKEVVGVDIFKLDNSNQDNLLIDNFLICNIETQSIPYSEGYFDVILCGDVVEHLIDPWASIRKMTFYLKKEGCIIISTPNFRNLKNFKKIYLEGDFKYDPAGGLLDKTHLRFFCKKNIIDLVKSDDLSFKSINSINDFPEYKFRPIIRFLNQLTFRLFEEFLSNQYVVVGIKK